MHYLSRMHGEEAVEELTKEQVFCKLDGHYKRKFVKDLIDNEKSFRLFTPYREIWTKTDEGLVPMPGFYGTVG